MTPLFQVRRRQEAGRVYDCIGAGRERWRCTAHDGGGFGEVLCDTLQQATHYFTAQPWASKTGALTLTLNPILRERKGPRRPDPCSESYLITREGQRWGLHCTGRQP